MTVSLLPDVGRSAPCDCFPGEYEGRRFCQASTDDDVNAHLTYQALCAWFYDTPIPPCMRPLNPDGAKIGHWWRKNDINPCLVTRVTGTEYETAGRRLRRNRDGEMMEVT